MASFVVRVFALALLAVSMTFRSWAQEPPCAGAELAQAKASINDAQKALDEAIAALGSPSNATLDRVQVWFGTRSVGTADLVRSKLIGIRAFTSSASFLCAVKTDVDLGDVYAYVNPTQSFVIVLGAFFFKAPQTGYSSKLGVMIHEMSHFLLAGATKDPTIYGSAAAKSLAAATPSAAQQNAENYEYFVESLVFGL